MLNDCYFFNEKIGIWQRRDFNGISYSDGDVIEENLYHIITQAKDTSILSEELARHCTDWVSTYHLSSLRANLLRPLRELLTGDILEIGAGCGAITRYLGECGGQVLALEGSIRRATIARARTREQKNITVVVDNFDQYISESHSFDVVTLIGVLEYAEIFMSGDTPALTMLKKAQSLLKPGGKLIIAIENQLGLKYFAGAPEDHLGLPMYGIEGRYKPRAVKTYGKNVLSSLLKSAGFQSLEFLAPFPDYKLPTSVISEWGFSAHNFDAAALAWQSVWRDPQLPDTLGFDPTLVWPIVSQNGLGLDLANSFLVVASKENGASISRRQLAWHFSSDRKSRFCKATHFVCNDHEDVEVQYQPLSDRDSSSDNETILRQRIPSRADYVKGECLSLQLIKSLNQVDWKIENIVDFVHTYFDCLKSITASREIPFDPKNADFELPGDLFDCIPQNIVITARGDVSFIDQEWYSVGSLQLGYLLLRALSPAFHRVAPYASDPENFDGSRLGLFVAIASKLGWKITPDTVYEYAKIETQLLQGAIAKVATLEEYLSWLNSPLKIRSNYSLVLPQKSAALAESTKAVVELQQSVIERDQSISELNNDIAEREAQIARQRSSYEQKSANYERQIEEIVASRSWKLTKPLRGIAAAIRAAKAIVRFTKKQVTQAGIRETTRKVLYVARRDGFRGLYRRAATLSQLPFNLPSCAFEGNAHTPLGIPYYIDPALDSKEPKPVGNFSLAIHLHLFYRDMMHDMCERIANIQQPFDLYVSTSQEAHCADLKHEFRSLLPNARKIVVANVPNRGRDIAPLIVEFGQNLSNYDIIGHFHTKKSPHDPALQSWCEQILDLLLGKPGSSGGYLAHIFEKLRTDTKIVYPGGCREILQERTGWAGNRDIAQTILQRYTNWSVDDFPMIEFPEGSMFWARSRCLQEMLQLPLTFNDFPREPIPTDGTLAHALERLILIFAANHEGQNLRLHGGDSIHDYRFYEPQQDFSRSIVHNDIQVLSFYLPQFHPIPENDEWHGKGFTEWTKVRGALPLFKGHYQQHIPHEDIGYYLLDSPDTLRKQAELMRKAGVSGQVFYHYWFNGKLILEEPAKRLLENSDINMPFCFCWANENWTRRWDGNEAEILLAQKYSEDDAREFIRYLLPFFQDQRYIRIDNRPVLFVYRPSSIPDSEMYLRIWAEECRAHGIHAPYVVAVLTRGATHPAEFGMDAGVERVLHDWTAGAVPDIKRSLECYTAMNGSALSYKEVAAYYCAQTDAKDFTYFRSIVPIWDNTARYGAEAFLVHASTPEYFQEWFESLVSYSKKTLPEDRRLILVNAWNEWAEGAHLEPDSRYGYAYLNSIGRTLSNIHYSEQGKLAIQGSQPRHVHITLPPYLHSKLRHRPDFIRRFSQVLTGSSILKACHVTIDAVSAKIVKGIPAGTGQDADYIIKFQRLVFFSSKMLERLIQYASCNPESAVIPNFYGDNALVHVLSNDSVESYDAYSSPIVVYPRNRPKEGFKNYKMCTHAPCFLTEVNTLKDSKLPLVTTVIRFHASGDINLLARALGCLAAMRNCVCIPLIVAQDLSPSQVEELSALLTEFSWHESHQPIVHHYQSLKETPDLRSKMLNESLRLIKSRYAGFLDYDDLLMPHAYEWLIERLNLTGKAVSFGRVYSTSYRSSRGLPLERARAFEYGYSYSEFIGLNHAPLHSFLLDLTKLDVNSLVYHEDQRYMEDYFLTLQLFTEDNCDWDSLRLNHYIGDYIHSIDRPHTLAFTEDSDRQQLLKHPDFLLCKNRIRELQQSLRKVASGQQQLSAVANE